MDEPAHERAAEGLRPAASRLFASALGLARTRLELVGVELAIERRRLQTMIVLAVAGAILATFAVGTVSMLVVAYFWDSYRYPAILGLALLYAVLAALAFARIRSVVHDAPAPFAATIAEFDKDRARLAGGTPPAP
ncbi:MAG: phage holin family protein [Burkholderiales bacterium]|nr:phage holin family protein [Burkholderiales bacterium]MCE7875922.1 hypothetical protein [Betaproteobacteria bacterium PRO3]